MRQTMTLPCTECKKCARWHVWYKDCALVLDSYPPANMAYNNLCDEHAVEEMRHGREGWHVVCVKLVANQFLPEDDRALSSPPDKQKQYERASNTKGGDMDRETEARCVHNQAVLAAAKKYDAAIACAEKAAETAYREEKKRARAAYVATMAEARKENNHVRTQSTRRRPGSGQRSTVDRGCTFVHCERRLRMALTIKKSMDVADFWDNWLHIAAMVKAEYEAVKGLEGLYDLTLELIWDCGEPFTQNALEALEHEARMEGALRDAANLELSNYELANAEADDGQG